MPKGVSLAVGLNSVDPNHYQGWSGDLVACEFDAQDMASIAKAMGFETQLLLTKQATRGAVIAAFEAAANKLRAGDIFLLSYSGHGGQLPDLNGDEDDAMDETWCLFDGEMIDDEIFFYLGRFEPGVRIFSLSDSCHSGTVLKDMMLSQALGNRSDTRYRAMPREVAQRTYLANKSSYDALGSDPRVANAKGNVQASALLISGCQDNQLSADGTFNGLFTAKLKVVWNGGKFSGTYRDFHKRISSLMPSKQSPNFLPVGRVNAEFEAQRPFTV